jgi:hypothetical protein
MRFFSEREKRLGSTIMIIVRSRLELELNSFGAKLWWTTLKN